MTPFVNEIFHSMFHVIVGRRSKRFFVMFTFSGEETSLLFISFVKNTGIKDLIWSRVDLFLCLF